MTEIVLLFPPQWSPFQPPLSVPSLAAWLRRDGFSVRALDANLDFYHWLYKDVSVAHCKKLIHRSSASAAEKIAYGAILDSAHDLASDIDQLQRLTAFGDQGIEYAVRKHFIAINSMDIFLGAVSKIAGDFTISPFSFQTIAADYDSSALQKLVEQPPPLLVEFVDDYIATRISSLNTSLVGISCIGQEQLFFSLLFGKRIKEILNVPVIVGGTIFARIFERGNLPISWFERYFDVIVRNEGEKPAAAILENSIAGRPLTNGVPGIVYLDKHKLAASAPCAPLKPNELPIPDFDDLPLGGYITGHISLPVLSSRGCYWGKCEFCHHGMVYGEKYGAYEAEAVLATVESHARRYGARHFAFNDEAIPPKIVRSIGKIFPDTDTSQWAFTGLIKFEKYFEKSDFLNLRRVGFRSLYVGLESASERVLSLMRKPNKKSTIAKNLADATEAGIWMHCFLFFGFPGETEEDAQETYSFMLDNEAIISSFGCATFSLEHNAPIFKHLQDFSVQLEASPTSSVNVYYDYQVSNGISAERSREWAARLNEEAWKKPKYFASAWVPREHLLSLLVSMSPAQLVAESQLLREEGNVPRAASTKEVFSSVELGGSGSPILAINRASQRLIRIEGASAALFRLMHDEDVPLAALHRQGSGFYGWLTGAPSEPMLRAAE
jgi:anaerobic magnesium-protoporphyrin IX monomethyl ester cyclase